MSQHAFNGGMIKQGCIITKLETNRVLGLNNQRQGEVGVLDTRNLTDIKQLITGTHRVTHRVVLKHQDAVKQVLITRHFGMMMNIHQWCGLKATQVNLLFLHGLQ